MAIYGYVRQKRPLPTNDQLKIVSDYHCDSLFIERGGRQDALCQLMAELVPGDTVVIASLQVFGQEASAISSVLKLLQTKQVQLISWSNQLHVNYYKQIEKRHNLIEE